MAARGPDVRDVAVAEKTGGPAPGPGLTASGDYSSSPRRSRLRRSHHSIRRPISRSKPRSTGS